MTTATKTKQTPAVLPDTYEWFTCEHGQYRIETTRYGLFQSIHKDGSRLVTGLTEQGVHDCTPLHLLAQQPDYDGRYDSVMSSASRAVDL